MKILRRAAAAGAALAVAMLLTLTASAVPRANPEDKVYDYANLLTSAQREELAGLCDEYGRELNMDFAVVTILDNEGISAESYANAFYDQNGLGLKEGGALLLVDMTEFELAAVTDGNADKALGGAAMDGILDDVARYLEDERDYEAFLSFLNQTRDIAAKSILPGTAAGAASADEGAGFTVAGRCIAAVLASALFTAPVMLILLLVNNRKVAASATPSAAQYLVGDIRQTGQTDTLVNSTTSQRQVPMYGGGYYGGGGYVGRRRPYYPPPPPGPGGWGTPPRPPRSSGGGFFGSPGGPPPRSTGNRSFSNPPSRSTGSKSFGGSSSRSTSSRSFGGSGSSSRSTSGRSFGGGSRKH